MRTEILQSVSGIYPNFVSIPIPEDINEVVMGLPSVASSLPDSDHKVPMPVLAILELDSIEVKNTLSILTAVVSKNYGDRFDTENLTNEWTNCLSGASKY